MDTYDPYELLRSPNNEAASQLLDISDYVDLSLNNNFNDEKTFEINFNQLSPTINAKVATEIISLERNGFNIDESQFGFQLLFDNHETVENLIDFQPSTLLAEANLISDHMLKNEDDKLCIIAQPKASYRERYSCETDKGKNRAQRYIRAEEENRKYEYPTIQIPSKWCDKTRHFYIRVTPVTVTTEKIPIHYVHPYEIGTTEADSFRDPDPKNNSIYFCIDENEFQTGVKSFHISRKKMIQTDLKAYGNLRPFNSNEIEVQYPESPQDAKRKIAIYQLWKSRFVFTLVEFQNPNSPPIVYDSTSVISHIMADETTDARYPENQNALLSQRVKCVPQKGDWKGGEEMFILMPQPLKRKTFSICFDFGKLGKISIDDIKQVDTKTISIQTPECPALPGDQDFVAKIQITENNSINYSIPFSYMSHFKETNIICQSCQRILINDYNRNKRPCQHDGVTEIISGMGQLTIDQNDDQYQMSHKEMEEKFTSFLNQLTESLATFIRTNDPSKLLRRTRVLLSAYDKNPPPLHEAIQQGFTDLSLSLIEQIIDMPLSNNLLEKVNESGETPLLIAVKNCQWKLIEFILTRRINFIERNDNEKNNSLHLLADLKEDKGATILKNLFEIIPQKLKTELLKQRNLNNQTPLEIAHSHGNTQCIDLLRNSDD